MKTFEEIRKNIVGDNAILKTPYGELPLIYADWIASGRMYKPSKSGFQTLSGLG